MDGSSAQGSSRKRTANASSDAINNLKNIKTNDSRSTQPKEETYHKGGLVHTLHGNIYQLKLQMLFLKNALKEGYEFSLGTEVEEAEKFDDLVFKYKKKGVKDKDEIRFVQAKHKQDESTKITVKELLKPENSDKNEFGLQKYFISFNKIKKNPTYANINIKDLIIFTNINFADLGSIKIEKIEESDSILKLTKLGKVTERYKLIVPKQHELYKLLQQTSELHILANTIKQHIEEKKKFELKNEIFKNYHNALCSKIFEVHEKKQKTAKNKSETRRFVTFKNNFLNGINLSKEVDNFQKILYKSFSLTDNGKRWQELSKEEFNISGSFGEASNSKNFNNELPYENIKDTDIEEFFEKLVFAVDQPSETELGKLITDELGKSCQLLTAQLVSDSFQRKMLDWFKEKRLETGKEGIWLNAQSGQEFLNSIENEVSSLISIGISVAYPEELARFNVTFESNCLLEDFKDFLSGKYISKKIHHVISPDKTLLSAIKIYDALEVLKEDDNYSCYRSKDSYIFIRLYTLLGTKIQKYVLNAFLSKENYYLLIIDCQHTASSSEILKLFMKIKSILEDTSKKIIIIDKEKSILMDLLEEDFEDEILRSKDITNFVDFTETSKENLLRKKLIFQGQKVCFNRLLDKSDDQIHEIIDEDIILKLLLEEVLSVNCLEPDLGEINDYYIKRKYRRAVFSIEKINEYLSRSLKQSDLFVISKNSSKLNHFNVFTYDNNNQAKLKFLDLCEKNAESNIHWFECNSNTLTWFESHGSIANIKNYRIREEFNQDEELSPSDRNVHEHEFISSGNRHKIVIISDTAGMGKSTVLTHMSMELKNDFSSLWVIRINLNDHTSLLRDLQKKFRNGINIMNKNDILTFFLNDLLKHQIKTDLEKKLFRNSFIKNGNVAFLIDGFDEIYPDYKNVVIALLKSLKSCNIEKLYVTTRQNVKHELEQALGIFSYVSVPFSTMEQSEFLTRFWSKHLVNNDENKKKLQIYVHSIINRICKSTYNKGQDIIGIPLQTKMVAEIFQENEEEQPTTWQSCQDFLQSDLIEPELPENYDLLDLYEQFATKKFYHIHYEIKKGRDLTKTGEEDKVDKEYEQFKENCTLLSFKSLFSDEKLEELLSKQQIQQINIILEDVKNNKYNEGIVDQLIDGKPHFFHRTFAEYFASFLISKKILVEPAATLHSIKRVLNNMSPIFMNNIIKQLDGKQQLISAILEKPLMHHITLSDCVMFFIKSLFRFDCSFWPQKLDASGKTPLHYVAYNGDFDKTVIIILNFAEEMCGNFVKTEFEKRKLVQLLNIRDNDDKTAIYYALQNNHIELAVELLIKGACIELLTDDDVLKLLNEISSEQFNNIEIFDEFFFISSTNSVIEEKLLLKAPAAFHNLNEKDQSRILSVCFDTGKVIVIDAILKTVGSHEEKLKILNKTYNGKTPLDLVINTIQLKDDERLEVTKYVLENGGKTSIYDTDYISQILQKAIESGFVKTFKYFILLEKPNNYNHHLFTACQFNQLDIVKYFLENHLEVVNKDGNTALHTFCANGATLKMIQLIVQEDNFNATNKKGETPLFVAIHFKNRLNIIRYLVEKGSHVNWEDTLGKTPLSCAVDSDQDIIAKYLLQNAAKLSEKASELTKAKVLYLQHPSNFNLDGIVVDGGPRLHTAIKNDNMKLTQFLVLHGADINKVDIEGKTPLHWACVCNNIEMVQLLLQHGAVFDLKDRSNNTPLDLLSESDTAIFRTLRILEKLFNSQNFKEDLMAEFCNESEENLRPNNPGYSNDSHSDNPLLFAINVRNFQGKTMAHLAASDVNGGEEAMKFLLKFNNEYISRQNEIEYTLREIKKSILIEAKDSEENSPLHLAAQFGNYKIVQLLLKEGVIFNGKNMRGDTSECLAERNRHGKIQAVLQAITKIFSAAEISNDFSILNRIKNRKFFHYLNSKNEFGTTLLHLAASSGQVGVVQFLLDNGVDAKVVDLNKNTPLHLAVQKNELKIVKLLLKYGAIYNARNAQDKAPIDFISNEDVDELKLLQGIDTLFQEMQSVNPETIFQNRFFQLFTIQDDISIILNSCDSKLNTLLHYAAELNEYDIFVFLLIHGACYDVINVNALSPKDLTKDHNLTALLKSVEKMFINSFEIYYELKVNINIITNVRDKSRKGLLYHAAKTCSLEIVKFLVERGARVNLLDIDYNSSEEATKHLHLAITKYLINNSEVSTISDKGDSPLLMATQVNTELEIIECLVERGSDVNQVDIFGNTPLSRAVESKNEDVIEYLLTKGAQISEKSSQSIRDQLESSTSYKNHVSSLCPNTKTS